MKSVQDLGRKKEEKRKRKRKRKNLMAAKIRLVGMFCGLGEERTRFRKKKKKKNLSRPNVGWLMVEMKEYLKTNDVR